MKVAILGAGLVGTPMALDLSQDEGIEVILVDRDEEQFTRAKRNGIKCLQADLMQSGAIEKIVAEVDYVINALPGEFGFKSLKRVIKAGKSGVDIAFYPDDFRELQSLAEEHHVSWVVDMGVAPGMSHLLSAYGTTQLDKTDDIKIYVGGLPLDTSTYWQYKAPFSPSDVIEEYTRPARFVRDGKIVSMPALTERELITFPVVGELEAFNSDGLRSLMFHLKVPNMIEKTLRYPGYIDKIIALKESGAFSEKKIIVEGKEVSPLALTSALLFKQWKLEEDDQELTVMQIRVAGQINGEDKTIVYDLYDEHCLDTNIHSMARTTGYTATVVLRQMIAGKINAIGVHAPEMLAFDTDLVENILKGLQDRGVVYKKTIK
ncbi:MAG: NAD-dependent epimerase/dehydratase family protein [Bacteroidales bacterium]|nr:NAD-dependent epimerase/dehydratase family protein [Bacteroidales bacterium]